MALEITYHANAANKNIPGFPILSETRTLSGTSAKSGATPAAADLVKITATEAARYTYRADDDAVATATAGANGHYLASGETAWLPAVPGYKVAGITPS